MRAGEFPDGSQHSPGQDRHGPPEHAPARPGHVPHPPRAPLPPRRRLVHLPDLRLGPRPERLHRGHHPLRSAPSSSRSTARSTTGSSTSSASTTPSRSSSPGSTSATPSSASASLLELVEGRLVDGWDDPRMPTISGLRRRGYTPEAIAQLLPTRSASPRSTASSTCRSSRSAVREDLNRDAAPRHGRPPPAQGRRRRTTRRARSRSSTPSTTPRTRPPARASVPFSRELYIERDDFMEDPPPKFYRLAPGREVRLRYAYFVTCDEVVKDAGRRRRRAPLHLRPGDPRRRRPRRPQGQGHPPLGLGPPRHRRRGPPLRHAVHGPRPDRPSPRGRLEGATSIPARSRSSRAPSSSRPWPPPRPRAAGSSSASATSSPTAATRAPAPSSSTGP